MVSTWSFLMVTTILLQMLNLSRRCLRFSLYCRLLCPMGEVFEGTRVQPASGIRYRVLWGHRDYSKQQSAAQKPRSPSNVPLPCRTSLSRSLFQ